jgi:hypothetical protein
MTYKLHYFHSQNSFVAFFIAKNDNKLVNYYDVQILCCIIATLQFWDARNNELLLTDGGNKLPRE